ncbi:hypothetical protein EJB05_15194, partial [Eragrostis curvula]
MQSYYLPMPPESITNAPVIHHFKETVHVVMTIRCFGKEDSFIWENLDQFPAGVDGKLCSLPNRLAHGHLSQYVNPNIGTASHGINEAGWDCGGVGGGVFGRGDMETMTYFMPIIVFRSIIPDESLTGIKNLHGVQLPAIYIDELAVDAMELLVASYAD